MRGGGGGGSIDRRGESKGRREESIGRNGGCEDKEEGGLEDHSKSQEE